MKLRKSSLYTVRSGSWKAQMGISRGCSLLPPPPPLEETWDRARETMLELAWEMPLDRRFSAMRNGGTLEYTQLTQRTFRSGKNCDFRSLPNTTTLFSSQIQLEKYRKWYFCVRILAPNIHFSCTLLGICLTFLSPCLRLFPLSFPNIHLFCGTTRE